MSTDGEVSTAIETEEIGIEEENELADFDAAHNNHIPIVVEINVNDGDNTASQGFFSSQSTQKPTIDVSVLNDSVDNYLSNASQEELTMLTKAVDDDKVKVLEYIIKNQINEEYVATELAEIKKYLTAEEVDKLNTASTLQDFQNLLRDYIKNYIQRRDFEILVDQLVVDSTKPEFDRLAKSTSDEEFKAVLLEMAEVRQDKYSDETTHSNFRAGGAIALPWLAKVAPTILAAAPKIFAGAVAIASSPITLGIVTVGAIGYVGYNIYNQAKVRSQQRIQQRQAEYARARQVEVNRQYALSLAPAVAQANIQRVRTQVSHIATPTYTSWGNAQQVTQRTYAQAGVTAMRQSAYNPTFTNQRIVAPQVKQVQSVATNGTHTVQAGESVWLIANRYGISMANLVAWNGIINNTIHPGQRLRVSSVAPTISTTGVHTVQSGESVWSISHKYKISMEELIRWNGIVNNTIHPNQKLTITTPVSLSSTIHLVQSGESVWGISRKYGISMDDLIKWNGIVNNTIHPNQKLIVSSPVTPTSQVHIVQSGESVWGISRKYGISMDDLIKWNGIVNNTIHPNQQLRVQAPTTSPTLPNYHKVASGESLWLIADRYGLTVAELKSLNNISGTLIHPNQELRLRPATTTVANATYTVQKGDSLWSIATSHRVRLSDLIAWNEIKDNTIHPGQKVTVKKPVTQAAPSTGGGSNKNDKDNKDKDKQGEVSGRIKGIRSIKEFAENVRAAYEGYKKANWRGNYKGQQEGIKAGGRFDNDKQYLPQYDSSGNPITYKKFDINVPTSVGRDAERFVVGSDGSVYYTNDHYEYFVKVE